MERFIKEINKLKVASVKRNPKGKPALSLKSPSLDEMSDKYDCLLIVGEDKLLVIKKAIEYALEG